MSQEDRQPQVGTGHYMAVCAFCLAVIFLVQLQAGLLLINLLGVMVGALALLYKLRLGPVFLLIMVSGAQVSPQITGDGNFGPSRPHGTMEITDVALCAAVLGYIIGHYRLQSIWYHLLPMDVRQRTGLPRRAFPWLRRQKSVLKEKRPAGQITAREIAWLVVTLPVWAVAAQLAWALIPRESNFLRLPVRLMQMLFVLWLLAVGLGVVHSLLNFWKHRRHDPATAQLYLQDLLWRDTRGEQRRVNRWLAWLKLARKETKEP